MFGNGVGTAGMASLIPKIRRSCITIHFVRGRDSSGRLAVEVGTTAHRASESLIELLAIFSILIQDKDFEWFERFVARFKMFSDISLRTFYGSKWKSINTSTFVIGPPKI